MLKSEFEKRHGRIWGYSNAIVTGYITEFTKKYDLENKNQPAPVWHVVKNMPDSQFTVLDLGAIQEIFKHLENVQPKPVRDYYLKTLDHRFFASGWGWFSRGGRGLSTFPRSISEIPDDEKKLAVRVLKCIKQGFMKYNYKAIYGRPERIKSLIKEYGGAVDGKMANYRAAKKKIEESTKLPRKTKKRVKAGWLDRMFASTTQTRR